MFNSVEAAVAAFSLGNVRFKCQVCGKSHYSSGKGWNRCMKKISSGTQNAVYGKYTVMNEKETRIKVPVVDVSWPLVYCWKVPLYPNDIKLLYNELNKYLDIEKKLNHLRERLVEMSALAQNFLPLEIALDNNTMEKYINSIAQNKVFTSYIEAINECVSNLNDNYVRFKHLFTITPPSFPIELGVNEIKFKENTFNEDDIRKIIGEDNRLLRLTNLPLMHGSAAILTKECIIMKSFGNVEAVPYTLFNGKGFNGVSVQVKSCGPNSVFAQKITEVIKAYCKTSTRLIVHYF
jgi:hypothetical protein